jgi:ribonuclease J
MNTKKVKILSLEQIEEHSNEICFLPLGGANEIGMNLNLYYYKGEWLMIDCGVGFADDTVYPGITLLLPKIDFLIKNNIKITAMIITHIHEDHIGGVVHLWNKLNCPVWATPIASSFLIEKFSDAPYKERPKINVVADSFPFDIGPFKLEFLGLTHSVPEMKAVILHTHLGPIVHTGDWKFDDKPVVGDTSDYKRLKELGKSGVYAVVCDSTNVFSEGWSGSEGELEDSIYKVIKNHKERVLISTFASNIARLQTISNLAKRTGRKLIVAGRSIVRMVDVARKNGYLFDTVDFYDQREAISTPRDKTLILCTGCQGEENAALTKIANREHAHVNLDTGDLVVFSSKIIPGNEKSIHHTFNQLANMDVDIVTEKMAKVHVSGHPYRGELKKMYAFLKPKIAIPVHGESAHLREHCKFAMEECGVEQGVRVKNGAFIVFQPEKAFRLGDVESGYLAIDGKLYRDGDSPIFTERRSMGNCGQVTYLVAINAQGRLVFQPELYTEGFLNKHTDKQLLKDMTTKIYNETVNILNNSSATKDKIAEILTKTIIKYCIDLTDKRPFVNVIFKKI